MCIWLYSIVIADFTANHICCRLHVNQGAHITRALLLYQVVDTNQQIKKGMDQRIPTTPQLHPLIWLVGLIFDLIG